VANLENLTPFEAIALPSMQPDGTDLLLVVVSGRFDLPQTSPRVTKLLHQDIEQADHAATLHCEHASILNRGCVDKVISGAYVTTDRPAVSFSPS